MSVVFGAAKAGRLSNMLHVYEQVSETCFKALKGSPSVVCWVETVEGSELPVAERPESRMID